MSIGVALGAPHEQVLTPVPVDVRWGRWGKRHQSVHPFMCRVPVRSALYSKIFPLSCCIENYRHDMRFICYNTSLGIWAGRCRNGMGYRREM